MFSKQELAEAEAARAAIRNAGPLYVQSDEAKARAEAEAETEAKAARAAKARAALPAIEYVPAPKVPAKVPTAAEAKAARAEARWQASRAREFARAELAEARAAAARAARRNAVVHSADFVFAEAKAEGQLETLAKAAGARGLLAEARARAEFLAASGMTEAEARTAELLEAEGRDITLANAPEAGQHSALSPAELAAVAEWTRAALASPAAVAGRQALEAIGPRADAVIISNASYGTLTVAKVSGVPDVAKAEERAAELAKELAKSRARLAEAEAALKAAEGQRARQPIRAAEAEADRVAAGLAKVAARAAKAEAALEAARTAAARPEAEGRVYVPVAELPLGQAAKAAELALRQRRDAMPARYADRGPSAKTGAKLTDNTARWAIANVLGATAEAEEQLWAELLEFVRAELAAKAAAKAEAKAAARAADKARRAMSERVRRRAAKLAKH